MTRIAKPTLDRQSPIEDFLALLEAVGEAASPYVRGYLAFCESPAGKQVAYAVNNAPLILGALAVAMLTAEERDEDAWYCECVEAAWGGRSGRL